MAKTDNTRRRKQQSKVVTDESVEGENTETQTEAVSSTEQTVGTEEVAPNESADMEQEEKDQDEKVKGSTPIVTVTWEKKNKEEGEGNDLEKRTNTSDQMTTKEMTGSEAHTQAASSADGIGCTGSAHSENPETKMEQEMEDIKAKQESQKDTAPEENETPVIGKKKNEEGNCDHSNQEKNGSEQMIDKEKAVNGKRKPCSNVEMSPSKKPKLINDGFCLFVGNLNSSKTSEEVKDSLLSYFMTQSLLVQNIRLDNSRKYAYVDLASEFDLTKALTLNGEIILDKPMRIAKAKVKNEDKVKMKAPLVDKKVKDARCLFLRNVPYNATKKDILKIFHKAIAVRFPGGTKSPSKGMAFVEFRNKTIARKVLQKKQGVKIQGRVLTVDSVGETNTKNMSKVTKANIEDNNTKAAVPPNNTLFVNNLSFNVTEKTLKKVFQNAVSINFPQNRGKPRRFAFVKFATVADAEKALRLSQNIKICPRAVRVQFCEMREKPEISKVQLKTLIIMDLAEKTTAETLKNAFEGALGARVIVNKDTGISKRFGFVDFGSEENCKAVKEAMEDCEIDGSKVTVAFAKPKEKKGHQGARERLVKRSVGQLAGRGGHNGRGGKGSGRERGHGAGTLQDPDKEVENKG